jgi:hypothetical protein
MALVRLWHGDCLDRLDGLPEGSVQAFVCDPPYDLTSVSRGGSPRQAGTGPYGRHTLDTLTPVKGGGFMGKAWDATGIAFSQDLWGRVYRALEPGGVVKAFCGTRTYHRMAAAMAKAGFEDMRVEAWSYGSGFPKSMNVSKMIDKAAGAERPILVKRTMIQGGGTSLQLRVGDAREVCADITAPATEAAKLWDGWGTALKPAWEPVVIARKPL